MFWRKKQQPAPEAVAPEPRTLFSTDSFPMMEAAPLPTIIRQKVGVHGEAMDSAGLTSDAMHVAGIPEAQFGWYASQGFIGYQACAILAQHWLIDKACSMPARDAVRTGYEVDAPDERIVEAIRKADKRHNIDATMREFIHMARVFGIRVAIFKVDSTDPEYYEKPFNLDGVTPGSYRGISQVDPLWMSPLLTGQSVGDPANMRFYEPTFYLINGQKYHHSHLCICTPYPVSDILKPSYQYGGISLPQRIYERVYAAERTANEAPQLAMTKRLTVFKTNMIAAVSNLSNFDNAMRRWAQWRDNYGVKIADMQDEDIQQFDTGLADLDATIMTQYQLVAAIANVPATKLLGTTPKGFNSTGDYEAASYREELESIQSNDLQRLLDRHHALVMRSEVAPALGIEPVNVTATWRPLDSPTAAEWAAIGLQKAQAAQIYASLGAIDGMDVREQLKVDKNSDYFGLPDAEEEAEYAEPVEGAESAPAEAAASGESIAQVSMNGAQIASLVEVLNGVAAKTMPTETAKEIIASAFPLDMDTINRMIAPMLTVEAPVEEAPTPFPQA